MQMQLFMRVCAFLYFLSTSHAYVVASTILIDNGGVISHTSSLAVIKEIGLRNLIHYMYILKKGPRATHQHLQQRLYDFLEFIADTYRIHCVCATDSDLPRDDKGISLPRIMCEWQKGTMNCREIRMLIKQALKKHDDWFAHPVEKSLINDITTMLFTPETFIKLVKINQKTVQFIRTCKEHGHAVYLFSNWDAESFARFQEKYSDLCELFDGTVVSGDVHMVKPEQGIYKHILEKYNLNPSDCFFFDNQKENIIAARACGINGILYTDASVLTLDQLPDVSAQS